MKERCRLKKFLLPPLVLAGACVACCMVPLMPAVLGLLGTGVATLGGLKMGLTFALFIALLFLLFTAIKRWRLGKAGACQTACPATTADKACDCQE